MASGQVLMARRAGGGQSGTPMRFLALVALLTLLLAQVRLHDRSSKKPFTCTAPPPRSQWHYRQAAQRAVSRG
jgi:hypothetical protein